MLRACLAVVLLICTVSPVLAQGARADASAPGSGEVSNRNASNANGAPQDKSAARPTTPASSPGGVSDEDALMRLRVPKWNSFLPGMFR